jgi:hypothetical protein
LQTSALPLGYAAEAVTKDSADFFKSAEVTSFWEKALRLSLRAKTCEFQTNLDEKLHYRSLISPSNAFFTPLRIKW